ncbi:MAG TPA: RNA polymerase subunit sigma-24 [Anaerolineae bacterium]|nr:RNA polymerase subunit sigma-24 [Anaerolineae bacterium]
MNVRYNTTARSEPPLPDEARLIKQAKSGNSEAFAQLYDAYLERVYRYIYFRVSDDALTEDLTSQVFLKAWENLDRYKIDSSPYIAWLYTVARNLVIDHYRTKKESLPLDDITPLASEDQTPLEEVEVRFSLQAMRDSLQSLTDDQQQVLILKFIAGLPNVDIAKMMNKKEGAVRALQMRALQTLSLRMEEKDII